MDKDKFSKPDFAGVMRKPDLVDMVYLLSEVVSGDRTDINFRGSKYRYITWAAEKYNNDHRTRTNINIDRLMIGESRTAELKTTYFDGYKPTPIIFD